MGEQVRIRVDLAAGAVEVDAPLDAIDAIFSRLESFIPQMATGVPRPGNPGARAPIVAADASDGDGDGDGSAESSATGKGAVKKRGIGKGKETYKMVSLPMDDAKRDAFRKFFAEKAPANQNDQTIVVMSGLLAYASIDSPTKDEIFSGFRLMPTVKVPGKISSVLGNLAGGGFVTNVGTGRYKLTHVGEDRVKLELPVKKSADK